MKASKILKCLGVTALMSTAIVLVAQPTDVNAYTLDYPTQDEIREKFDELQVNIIDDTTYDEDYSTTSPYATGDVSDADRKNALAAVNFCRYLAGLPSDVKLSSSYNEYTQAASLVNASNDTLSHYPVQPNEMDSTLYSTGYTGARSSNISWGYSSIANSVINGYVYDTDSSNIDRVGHRRWVLNPKMQYTGFGMVGKYSAMYAFDNSRSEAFTGDYVAWPPKNMPNELYSKASSSDYGYAFSVTLGSAYDTPSLSNVTVDITSSKLGKSWHLDSTSTDPKTNYLNVENSNYGSPKCIIFNVGAFPESDTVSVTIKGITKSGVSSPITYTVNFFDLFEADSEYNKVGFSQDEYDLYIGETIKIRAYNNPLETKSFTWWYYGDADAAKRSLDTTGMTLTGLKEGTLYFYVEDNGVRYETKVNVICNHSYSTEWTIDVEPTTTSEGSKSHHCTLCGAKTDITVIEKLTEPLTNTSTISATTITLGSSIKLTASATGGTAPYKYKYYCKPEGDSDWTALTGTTTNAALTKKPARAINYQFAVKIADSKGKTATKYFTVKVNAPLTNTSTISAATITKGTSIKMTASATGGTAPYKYKYYCKPEGSTSYTALTSTTTEASYTHKPARAISYSYAVKIADASGKTATKYFTVKVNAPLTNTSTISAASITLGSSIKMTASATGGTAPYKYKYYCKPEGSTSYTALTSTTTEASFTHKPARAISYSYAVKIADANGKTSTKYFTVTVKK